MVSFETWVSVVFEHIQDGLGVEVVGPEQAGYSGADAMEVAGQLWSENKSELKSSSRREALSYAEDHIGPP